MATEVEQKIIEMWIFPDQCRNVVGTTAFGDFSCLMSDSSSERENWLVLLSKAPETCTLSGVWPSSSIYSFQGDF